MTISKGDRVRIVTAGVVVELRPTTGVMIYRIELDSDNTNEGDRLWFEKKDLAVVATERANEAWREIVADMIRGGRDREAVAMLTEHSPDIVPYIKALENVVDKLGAICMHSVLWEQIQRLPETLRPTFTKEQADAIDVAYAMVASRRG